MNRYGSFKYGIILFLVCLLSVQGASAYTGWIQWQGNAGVYDNVTFEDATNTTFRSSSNNLYATTIAAGGNTGYTTWNKGCPGGYLPSTPTLLCSNGLTGTFSHTSYPRMSIMSGNARQGDKYARYVTYPGDSGGMTSYDTVDRVGMQEVFNLNGATISTVTEWWTAFSWRVPSDQGSTWNTSDWMSVHIPGVERYNQPTYKQFAINVDFNALKIKYPTGFSSYTQIPFENFSGFNNFASSNQWGIWHDFIMRIKFSNTTTGAVEIWYRNGTNAFQRIHSDTNIRTDWLEVHDTFNTSIYWQNTMYRGWDIPHKFTVDYDNLNSYSATSSTDGYNTMIAAFQDGGASPPEVNYNSPNITSWGNNNTNNDTLTIHLDAPGQTVSFNLTSNQTLSSWTWKIDTTTITSNINNTGTTSRMNYTFNIASSPTFSITGFGTNSTSGLSTQTKTWTVTVDPPTVITPGCDVSINNSIIGTGGAAFSECSVILDHIANQKGNGDNSMGVGYLLDNSNDGSSDWGNVYGTGNSINWTALDGTLKSTDNSTKSFAMQETAEYSNVSLYLKVKEFSQANLWSATIMGHTSNIYDFEGYSIERPNNNGSYIQYMNTTCSPGCSYPKYQNTSDANRNLESNFYYIFERNGSNLNLYIDTSDFSKTNLISTMAINRSQRPTGNVIVLSGQNVSFDRIRAKDPNRNSGNITSAYDASNNGANLVVANVTINVSATLTGTSNYTVYGHPQGYSQWDLLATNQTTSQVINITTNRAQIYETKIVLTDDDAVPPYITRIYYQTTDAPAETVVVGDYISQWAFNNNFNDSNATSNNYGTATTGITFNGSVMKEGNASGFFDSGSDDMTFNNIALNNLSYVLWFKTTNPSGGTQDVFENMNTLMRIHGSLLKWYANTTAANVNITWANDTNWHHFAVTQSGTACSLYLDGNETATTCPAIRNNSSPGTIGSWGGSANTWFYGFVDGVRVYDRVLSSSELSEIMGATYPSTDYIPPVPVWNQTNDYNTSMSFSWYAGTGNTTNYYNASINGTWYNQSSVTLRSKSVNPHESGTITIFAFNSSGNTSMNQTPLSFNYVHANKNITMPELSLVEYNYSEGQTFYVDADYTDLDGDTPVFSKVCSLGTLDTATGNLTVTTVDGDQGNYSCQMNVTDGYGSYATRSFSINIANSTPGIPMNLTGINIYDDTGFLLRWLWEDGGNSDYYHIIMNGSDLGLFLSNNVSYSNTTSGHQTQTFNISSYSSELGVYSAWSNITTTTDNYPPYFDYIDNVTVDEGQWTNISMLNTTDANGDSYTFGTNATHGTLTGYNFTWLTTTADAGSYSWYFNVTDSYDGSNGTQLVYVNVEDAGESTPPTPVSCSATKGNFWINTSCSAGTGNTTDAMNKSINGVWYNTSAFYYNSTLSAHAWQNVSFYAYNNSYPGTLNTTAATLDTQIANNVPVLTYIGPHSVNEGELLSHIVGRSDADADPSIFAVNRTVGNSNLSGATFTWTPAISESGTYIFRFYANDSYGGSDYEDVTITVNEVASSVSITTYTPTSLATIRTGIEQTFTITGSSGGITTYHWKFDGVDDGDTSNIYTKTFNFNRSAASQRHTVSVYGTNGSEMSNTVTWTTDVLLTAIKDYDFDKNFSDIGTSDLNVVNLTTIGASPYIQGAVGTIFWGVIFALIFIMIWLRQEDVTIPSLLGLIIGLSLWSMMPEDWVSFAMSLSIISFAGIMYTLIKGRR